MRVRGEGQLSEFFKPEKMTLEEISEEKSTVEKRSGLPRLRITILCKGKFRSCSTVGGRQNAPQCDVVRAHRG